MRRLVVAPGIGAVVLLALTALVAPPAAPQSVSRGATPRGEYAFVSIPDFLNSDLADVSTSPFWEPGDPNSIDPIYRRSISTVLADLRDEPGNDVLVAGDLVRGRWGRDDEQTGIFGPVDTDGDRAAAVRLAAATYFSAMRRRFRRSGLRLLPAVGDHDIGDNPWRTTRGDWYEFKQRHLMIWKRAWARRFTASGTRFPEHPMAGPAAKTAYALEVAPTVLLVTVDEFQRTRGNVVPRLDEHQLAWFKRTLAHAYRRGTPWVFVQGHLPVLLPVRSRYSSDLRYAGGTSSPFWRAMRRYGVDLYLCGEVHDTTAVVPADGGPLQISHGGLMRYGQMSFLSGQVSGDTLRLQSQVWSASRPLAPTPVWQSDGRDIVYDGDIVPGPWVTGRMVLTSDGVTVRRSGTLGLWSEAPESR